MTHRFLNLATIALLTLASSCSPYGKVSYSESPKIINVSHYDPKEKQRSGRSYSPADQSALKANGAHGLIARCGKGPVLDTKCSDFLAGAERQGMLLGSYYYLLPNTSPSYHADRFINRLLEIKKSRGLRTGSILLVADIHTNCSAAEMVAFVEGIKKRTGKYPVVYLENSSAIRRTLNNATRAHKSVLRKCPYWLALYSNTNSGLETPRKLTKASGVWGDWCMWQYGGVWWKNGRSVPYNYRGGKWKTPKYFGNLDRPVERNGFNGTTEELYAFWEKHSWAW
ncbi:MAG: GH25 family lysozyme [Akkermansiaceae bacterium]